MISIYNLGRPIISPSEAAIFDKHDILSYFEYDRHLSQDTSRVLNLIIAMSMRQQFHNQIPYSIFQQLTGGNLTDFNNVIVELRRTNVLVDKGRRHEKEAIFNACLIVGEKLLFRLTPNMTGMIKQAVTRERMEYCLDYFGANLQYMRCLRNLTGDELAEIIGCSGRYVRRMEEENVIPSKDYILKICSALGCHPDDLLYTVNFKDNCNTADQPSNEEGNAIWKLINLPTGEYSKAKCIPIKELENKRKSSGDYLP